MRSYTLCLAFIIILLPSAAPAQWVPTGGPEGGEIYSLTSNGVMTLAATFNGVFRTTDSGATWVPANTGLTKVNLTCIRYHGSALYASTAAGVFVSTDNGDHWSDRSTGLPGMYYIRSIAFAGTDLFVGVDVGGVYRSTDNGATWDTSNVGLPMS